MALACAAFLGIVVGLADPIMIFGENNTRAAVADEMIVLAEQTELGLGEIE